MDTLNHGSRASSKADSHRFPPSPRSAKAESTNDGEQPSVNRSSTPASTASRASPRSSSSGRYMITSMPATIRAAVWSLISGHACLQNWKNTTYAP